MLFLSSPVRFQPPPPLHRRLAYGPRLHTLVGVPRCGDGEGAPQACLVRVDVALRRGCGLLQAGGGRGNCGTCFTGFAGNVPMVTKHRRNIATYCRKVFETPGNLTLASKCHYTTRRHCVCGREMVALQKAWSVRYAQRDSADLTGTGSA